MSYMTVLVMYVFARLFGVLGMGYAIALNQIVLSLVRVYFAHKIVGIEISYWAEKIVLPIMIVAMISLGAGYVVSYMMQLSLLRICVTIAITLSSLLLLSNWIVFDSKERQFMRNMARRVRSVLAKKN